MGGILDWNKSSTPPPSGLSDTLLVGKNAMAVLAYAYEAERLGYNPIVLDTTVEGKSRVVVGLYSILMEGICLQRGEGGVSLCDINSDEEGGGEEGKGRKDHSPRPIFIPSTDFPSYFSQG